MTQRTSLGDRDNPRGNVHWVNAPSDVIGRVSVVLRAVAACEPTGATTALVARTCQLPRPTVHRLLTTLLGEGLLDRDDAGRWLLGPELFLLGAAAGDRYDVRAVAHPWVRQLATETEESAFFSVLRGDETVCLVREDGAFPIRSHVLSEGVRFPLGVASAGIAILAFLPERQVEQFLATHDLRRQFGPAHSTRELRRRLDETRRLGWSLNPGLIVSGSWGMGAAVFGPQGRPIGALSVTGIEARFDERRQPQIGARLLRTAHDLSKVLAKG